MSDDAPDCGDNSCRFGGKGKGGMRTNGGCRCLKDVAAPTRRYFERLQQQIEQRDALIRELHENMRKLTYSFDSRERMEQAFSEALGRQP